MGRWCVPKENQDVVIRRSGGMKDQENSQCPCHTSIDVWFFVLCIILFKIGSHSIVQAGLKLYNPPTTASRVLRLKACTHPKVINFLLMSFFYCFYAAITNPLSLWEDASTAVFAFY